MENLITTRTTTMFVAIGDPFPGPKKVKIRQARGPLEE